jgi:hypothetical protein
MLPMPTQLLTHGLSSGVAGHGQLTGRKPEMNNEDVPVVIHQYDAALASAAVHRSMDTG